MTIFLQKVEPDYFNIGIFVSEVERLSEKSRSEVYEGFDQTYQINILINK